jgi:hypothetical protein
MKPSDILGEARVLNEDEAKSDARRRTIVGRAYYAAYHHVIQSGELVNFKYEPEKRDVRGRHLGRHQQLIAHLAGSKLRGARIAADKLATLRLRRRDADYDLDECLPRGIESDSVKIADEIINEDLA